MAAAHDAAPVTIRPAEAADAEEIDRLKHVAFTDLARRVGAPPLPAPSAERVELGRRRVRHLIRTDPAHARVAIDEDGQMVGGALGAVREGLFYLSLLFVAPDGHSRGIGRRLMRAVTPEEGPGMIASSADERALRLYALHGFAPSPMLNTVGPLRHRPDPDPEVIDGAPTDPVLAQADRHGRGAARTRDLDRMLDGSDVRLRVLPGRGYAISSPSGVLTVAALDDGSARRLLVDALSFHEQGTEPEVWWMRGDQQWAVDVTVRAGFGLRTSGAVCSREVTPSSSYLTSGPYL